jgi:hypothetical protein
MPVDRSCERFLMIFSMRPSRSSGLMPSSPPRVFFRRTIFHASRKTCSSHNCEYRYKTLIPRGRVITKENEDSVEGTIRSQNPHPARAGHYTSFFHRNDPFQSHVTKPSSRAGGSLQQFGTAFIHRIRVTKPSSRAGGSLRTAGKLLKYQRRSHKTLIPRGRVITRVCFRRSDWSVWVTKPSSRAGGSLQP